jgi:hypothetical protein
MENPSDESQRIENLSQLNETAYSPDGVDLTLIRWMLSLTPVERLKVLQRHMQGIVRLRNGHTST